jgi:hypothetical protein
MSDLVDRLRDNAAIKDGEAWRRVDGGQDLSIGSALATEAAERIEALEAALRGITDRYVELANSGDAGFWDPEKEGEVIAARAALKDGK